MATSITSQSKSQADATTTADGLFSAQHSMPAQAGTGLAWVAMIAILDFSYSLWSRANTSLALFTNSKLQEKRDDKSL
jgi:hypothetical protein